MNKRFPYPVQGESILSVHVVSIVVYPPLFLEDPVYAFYASGFLSQDICVI
jgi:hypothetical protein